jgi:RNA polymerase sigma-70 factor (ECF subfamily)
MATQYGTSPDLPDAGWPGPQAQGAGRGAASLGYLLAKVARGDREAFASIYDQAAGPVYSLLRRMTGDPSHSEDLTGEVLTEVWRTAPLFSPSAGSGMGWIMAIARRHAVGHVRAARAAASASGGQRPEAPGIVKELAEQAGVSPRGKQIPGGPPPQPEAQRQALLLIYYGGYTGDQVAGFLGVLPVTVSAWIRAGLTQLGSDPEW